MCRSIKTLSNFEPPATDAEMRAAARQFVRKISGTTRPSVANSRSFETAVDEVSATIERLLGALQYTTAPKNRDVEAQKNRIRNARRLSAER